MPGVYCSRLQVNSRQDVLLVWVVKITGPRPSNATLTSLFRFAHVLDHRPFQYSLTCVFMRPKHPTRGKDNLHLLAFRLPCLGTIAAVRSEFSCKMLVGLLTEPNHIHFEHGRRQKCQTIDKGVRVAVSRGASRLRAVRRIKVVARVRRAVSRVDNKAAREASTAVAKEVANKRVANRMNQCAVSSNGAHRAFSIQGEPSDPGLRVL